jgi:inner membrane protein
MASIGHALVGLAIARGHDTVTSSTSAKRSLGRRLLGAIAFPLLALLPDCDVVAFKLGIPYGAAFGHRGASHSIVAAVTIGLLVAPLVARALRTPLVPTAVAAVLAVLSHGPLDMLTDGGHGVAALWPFDGARHFFPWQPLPVAPIGRSFLSAAGLKVALTELAVFSPVALYALLGGRPTALETGRSASRFETK